MTQSITIDIAPGGKVTVEAHGYTGKTCVEATRFIEAALGPPAANRKTKPCYNQTVTKNIRTKLS
jgi:hypothetical protein